MRLLPLIGIIGLAWLLIFLGSYIIFYLITPINIFPGKIDYVYIFLNALLKLVLSMALVILWIMIMVKLRNLYMKRKLG